MTTNEQTIKSIFQNATAGDRIAVAYESGFSFRGVVTERVGKRGRDGYTMLYIKEDVTGTVRGVKNNNDTITACELITGSVPDPRDQEILALRAQLARVITDRIISENGPLSSVDLTPCPTDTFLSDGDDVATLLSLC